MKLTPSQIETIELYLLSHELRDRDFYNEMLDHFIVTLEKKLDEGEDFHYAFPELTYEFANFEYKPTWVSSVFGLKGMETEFITNKGRNSRMNFFGQIIKSFNTSNTLLSLLIFVPALLLYFFVSERWSVKYVGFFNITLFFIGLWHWYSGNYGKLRFVFKSSLDLSLKERKAKQLEEFGDTYFLLLAHFMMWPFFTVSRMVLEDFVPIESLFIPYILIQTFLSIELFMRAYNGIRLMK